MARTRAIAIAILLAAIAVTGCRGAPVRPACLSAERPGDRYRHTSTNNPPGINPPAAGRPFQPRAGRASA